LSLPVEAGINAGNEKQYVQGRDMKLLQKEGDEPLIPREVVEMVIRLDMPLVKAWRLYKGMSVEEAADASDLRTYEVLQLETADNRASFHLEKMASGLGLKIDQVVDL